MTIIETHSITQIARILAGAAEYASARCTEDMICDIRLHRLGFVIEMRGYGATLSQMIGYETAILTNGDRLRVAIDRMGTSFAREFPTHAA